MGFAEPTQKNSNLTTFNHRRYNGVEVLVVEVLVEEEAGISV